jgi:hypothetical protein
MYVFSMERFVNAPGVEFDHEGSRFVVWRQSKKIDDMIVMWEIIAVS